MPEASRSRYSCRQPGEPSGLAQLSLVEHALCPLDDRSSLVRPLTFETSYFRAGPNGHARFVPVRVHAQDGLSAHDEFYLWGLLALTFAQPKPALELWCTPHWCLKHLGLLDSRGGTNYARFRQALRRLAGVTYYCEKFYDPIRKEERDRAFGFLKYDLPLSDTSARAWRIVWDPLFFEYCQARGGHMAFDLPLYQQLDPATRRLFLLLNKVFWRRPTSPNFDVWSLAVHGLGFSSTLHVRDIKVKLARLLDKLLAARVIGLPPGTASVKDLFQKKATGSYAVRLQQGPYFDQPTAEAGRHRSALADSPLHDPLRAIGFTEARIGDVLKTFPRHLVEVWSDITLAKIERDGPASFTNCPEAYFLDNLKHATAGKRTPPDWWWQLKKEEEQRRCDEERSCWENQLEDSQEAWQKARTTAFKQYVDEKVGRAKYEATVRTLVELFEKNMSCLQARETAIREVERHFASSFQFPEFDDWSLLSCSKDNERRATIFNEQGQAERA